LNHCQTKLDCDRLGEISYRTNQSVVTFLVKQRLNQTNFILAAQTLHSISININQPVPAYLVVKMYVHWQVTPHSCEMGFINSYTGPFTIYVLF